MAGDGPVTVLATRRARPGREKEFEVFLEGLPAVFRRAPGNLGMTVAADHARDLPVITVVSVVTGPLLATLSAPLRFLLITPVLTAAMTWVMMPALARAFGRFL